VGFQDFFTNSFIKNVNGDLLEVISWKIRSFSIITVVKKKVIGVIIRITTVYGSPYKVGKNAFISELITWPFPKLGWPSIIGDDFNLVRSQCCRI
jgi:hypothetical protein